MKLENEFTVPAPVERAWDVMLDVERIAPCLPGAAIESSPREYTYFTGYYAVFFYDPDGIKLEILHVPPRG